MKKTIAMLLSVAITGTGMYLHVPFIILAGVICTFITALMRKQ